MTASAEPRPPHREEYGRVFTHGQMSRGWSCRWCGRALVGLDAAQCLACDRNPNTPV